MLRSATRVEIEDSSPSPNPTELRKKACPPSNRGAVERDDFDVLTSFPNGLAPTTVKVYLVAVKEERKWNQS